MRVHTIFAIKLDYPRLATFTSYSYGTHASVGVAWFGCNVPTRFNFSSATITGQNGTFARILASGLASANAGRVARTTVFSKSWFGWHIDICTWGAHKTSHHLVMAPRRSLRQPTVIVDVNTFKRQAIDLTLFKRVDMKVNSFTTLDVLCSPRPHLFRSNVSVWSLQRLKGSSWLAERSGQLILAKEFRLPPLGAWAQYTLLALTVQVHLFNRLQLLRLRHMIRALHERPPFVRCGHFRMESNVNERKCNVKASTSR